MTKIITDEEQQALNKQLLNAAVKGDVTAIKQALTAGAEVDARNREQNTPLHLAANPGHSKAIKALLAAGAEVDAPGKWQNTPLHFASFTSSTQSVLKDIAKLLLAVGASPVSKDTNGTTPIDLASGEIDFANYMRFIANGTTPRPTPDEVGLDMEKRNVSLIALGKKPVVGSRTSAVNAQRQAVLDGPEQGI